MVVTITAANFMRAYTAVNNSGLSFSFRFPVHLYYPAAVRAFQRHDNPAGTRLPNITGPFLAPSLRAFHFPYNTTSSPPKYICCYLPALIWNKGTSLSLPVPFYPLCFIGFLPFWKSTTPKTLRTFYRTSIPALQNPGSLPGSADSPAYV